jgi:hypothetical protein
MRVQRQRRTGRTLVFGVPTRNTLVRLGSDLNVDNLIILRVSNFSNGDVTVGLGLHMLMHATSTTAITRDDYGTPGYPPVSSGGG